MFRNNLNKILSPFEESIEKFNKENKETDFLKDKQLIPLNYSLLLKESKEQMKNFSKDVNSIIFLVENGDIFDHKKEIFRFLVNKIKEEKWKCFISVGIVEIEGLINRFFKYKIEDKGLAYKYGEFCKNLKGFSEHKTVFKSFLVEGKGEDQIVKGKQNLNKTEMRNRFCHGKFQEEDYSFENASIICYILFFIEIQCLYRKLRGEDHFF